MALKDIIAAPIRTITKSTIEKLEDAVSAHEIEVDRAQRVANQKYLDQIQGAAPGPSAKAQTTLRAAQDELTTAQNALAEARKQHAVKQDVEAAADIEKRWRATEKLGKRRRDLAVDVDVAIENMARAVKELTDVSTAMHSQAPVTTTSVAHTRLSRAAIEGAVRLNLSKHGFIWAAQSNMIADDNVQSVRETIEQGNVETLSKKPAPEADAA